MPYGLVQYAPLVGHIDPNAILFLNAAPPNIFNIYNLQIYAIYSINSLVYLVAISAQSMHWELEKEQDKQILVQYAPCYCTKNT